MSSKKPTRALGRGLDAILQSPETDITANDISGNFVVGAIAEIDINHIETNPFQPRSDFDEMQLRELAKSIKSQGIIQPVTVRKMGYEKYQLISGERRFRASKLAGLKKIPCYIRLANDEQMLEMALIENIHRQDLNALEVAFSYQRLIDELDLTQEKLSEKVGKNRSTITNFLRLLKLPAEVQVALRDNLISMGHARALLGLGENSVMQKKILKKIIDKGLSVRQVEQIVRGLNDTEKGGGGTTSSPKLEEKYLEAAKELSYKYGTKIAMKKNNKGKGNIVISFKDDEDLDRILNLLK
jgi:ParB family chromosome partitioning protein